MYVWLWRRLPGPLAVRLVLTAAALLIVVIALMAFVFPRVEALMPSGDVLLSGLASTPAVGLDVVQGLVGA